MEFSKSTYYKNRCDQVPSFELLLIDQRPSRCACIDLLIESASSLFECKSVLVIRFCATNIIHSFQKRLEMPLKYELYTAVHVLSSLRPRSPDLKRSSRQCSALCCDCRLYAQTCKTSSYQAGREV
jgi:hypothetical protein